MADTVLMAFRMSEPKRRARMKRIRRTVRKENVFRWVDSFLKAGATLGGRSPRAFEKRRRSAALQNATT
jgi:trehalose-6-phosphate synthase